jgi:hypothetical protein
LLIGFADFVLVIALGCVRSKNVEIDYGDVFGGEPLDRRAAPAHRQEGHRAPSGEHPDAAREDDAIARALEAHRRGSAEPAPLPQPVPMAAAARVAGFGRKGL